MLPWISKNYNSLIPLPYDIVIPQKICYNLNVGNMIGKRNIQQEESLEIQNPIPTVRHSYPDVPHRMRDG